MSLVEHARRELTLFGEDPETIDAIVSVVQAFADTGSSGGSAPYIIAYLEKLLRFEPLTPLTSDPAEWIDRSDISGYPIWQSSRDGRAMSEDGGKTYWLVNECEAAGSKETTPLHTAADPVGVALCAAGMSAAEAGRRIQANAAAIGRPADPGGEA